MRLDNTYTTPEQRFFFPASDEVLHHESVDTANLPGVISLGDPDPHSRNSHYLVTEVDGAERSFDLDSSLASIPGAATLLWLRGLSHDQVHAGQKLGFYGARDIAEHLEVGTTSYDPHVEGNVKAIVEPNNGLVYHNYQVDGFDERGIGIVPVDEPLPEVPREAFRHAHSPTKYRLHGFITADDKLVHWSSPTDYVTRLVDWCVALETQQNALEDRLLRNGLYDYTMGGHLGGLLSSYTPASAYLSYYDAKHGTDFFTTEDPRFGGKPYPELNPEQTDRWEFLLDVLRSMD